MIAPPNTLDTFHFFHTIYCPPSLATKQLFKLQIFIYKQITQLVMAIIKKHSNIKPTTPKVLMALISTKKIIY